MNRRLPAIVLALVLRSAVAFTQTTWPSSLLDDSTPIQLPWSDVLALLKRTAEHKPTAPPFEFALGAAQARGQLRDKNLSLVVDLPVAIHSEEWVAIPLFDPNLVRSVLLDGKPAGLAEQGGLGVLLAKGRGDHKLSVTLNLPVASSGESATLTLQTAFPISWHLVLPGSEAHLTPAARQSLSPGPEGAIVLDAVTSPAPTIQIDWSGLKGSEVAAHVLVESLTFVTFQEGTTTGRAHFSFEISGARRDRLSIILPSAIELLSVEAEDLNGWTLEPAEGNKRLTASFRRPRHGVVSLDFSFELPRVGENAQLPSLYAEGVDEQRAYVAASAETPLSMTAGEVAGGLAIDAKHLPAHLLRGVKIPFTLAYRHGGKGFQAAVHLEKNGSVPLAQATIDAAYFTTVVTEDGREVVKATLLVKNNLRPFLGVTLPKDSTLWAAFVSGESVNPASEGGRLLVPLVKSRELGEGETLATHVLQQGWSLSDVALHYYHDASKWRLIQQENGAVLGGNRRPQVGQSLKIPRLSGPGGRDLETAFPVELVYSRDAPKVGRDGKLDLELAVPDLGVMKTVWTLYLPSRLDPLSFGGNLTQTSYIRYGLLRRFKQLAFGPLATAIPSVLVSDVWAGEASYQPLRKRFQKFEQQDLDDEPVSHPRDSLPLVGRPYVFQKFLLEGEQPHLTVLYLDRSFEGPVRTSFLIIGLALTLLLARAFATSNTRAARTLMFVGGGYALLALLIGHFVLGTYGRAATGLVLGAWLHLLQLLIQRVRKSSGLNALLGRALVGTNALSILLLLLVGFGSRLLFVSVLCAVGGWIYLSARWFRVVPAAAALLLLSLSRPAHADGLPARSEVTVPFGKLKGLLNEKPAPRAPAQDHALLSATYAATLANDSLDIQGDLELDVYSSDWIQLPLVSEKVSLLSVTLDGKPTAASVTNAGPDARYMLTFKGAGRHRVHLSLVAPSHDPGAVSLMLVPGISSALTLHLPAADLEPEMSGATEVRAEGKTVSAVIPPKGEAEFRWTVNAGPTRSSGVPSDDLRMTARTVQIVSVDEQRVRVYALVHYRLQRGNTRHFEVKLPTGVELLDVQGEGIADHQVLLDNSERILTVTTESNVRDEFELSFAYDWSSPKEGGVLPEFVVRNVRSESGTLGVEAAGSTEVQLSQVEGASQIDVRSAPELFGHTDKPILHAIRYLQHPYVVKLAFVRHREVELETATVDRAEYTTVIANDGRAISQGVFKIRNARRAFLGVTLPNGSEVQSVLIDGKPAKPVQDAKGTLLLPLLRSASSDREMQQFEVEVVYLTRLAGLAGSTSLPPLLPAIDLRASKVGWSLYLPLGATVSHRVETEAASDSMQWATAPRAALYATRGSSVGGNGEVAASVGILPVRFNLPTHGDPERFWLHYLPAGVAPHFKVSYSPRSLSAPVQALVAGAAVVAAMLFVLGGRRWRRGRVEVPPK